MNRTRPYILIAIGGLLLLLPFLGSTSLFDWDEINFAESAREMLLTGNYRQVTVNFEPFWEKPPLFFWLQAVTFQLLGVSEFAARLPNVLVGIVTLCLIFYIGNRFYTKNLATLWVLFYLGSITPQLYLHSGIIDPLFNLFIFLSIWQLFLTTTATFNYKNYLFCGLFLGLAVLTKGPVAVVIVALCGLAFWVHNRFKFWFNFKQLILIVLTAVLMTSLWFVPEILINGPGFLKNFIAYQIDLFRNPVASHGQPWYYHFVVLLLGCIPASVLMIPTLVRPTADRTEFLHWMKILFWVVLILFSLVTTKIVHYSSMCYLPIAFMAAHEVSVRRISRPITVAIAVLLIFWTIALISLPFLAMHPARFMHLIEDEFAKALIDQSVGWSPLQALPGLFFVVCTFMLIKALLNNSVVRVKQALIGFALATSSVLSILVPKIEAHLQRDIVNFYKSIQDKDCYVEVYGFKSYAHFFYAAVKPLNETDGLAKKRQEILGEMGVKDQLQLDESGRKNVGSKQMDWLMHGDIDKTVYLVCLNKKEAQLAKLAHLKKIYSRGGYAVFMRMP